MPNFNLAPVDDDNLDPVWPTKPSPAARGMTAGEARAAGNQRAEAAAGSVPVIGGVLKAGTQFMNMLASPDTKAGIVTGPVNAVSKLGNAVGDLVQGKPVDVKDAWQITPQQARQFNPFRVGTGQEVTPADEAGLQAGGAIGAEVIGAALTGGVGTALSKAPAGVRLLNSLKNTAAVRRLAVAQSANPALRTGLGLGKNVAETLVSTAAAALFMDADQGNTADAIKDFTGISLPGRTDPNANYLQRVATNTLVDGIATPLSLIGAGSAIRPIRRWMSGNGIEALDEIAQVELAPYMGARPPIGPERQLPPAPAADLVDNGSRALPPAGQSSFDYSRLEAPPAQYDSAISRAQAEQTQIRQVAEQRKRLQDMGLVQQGEGGQLELSVGNAIDPEARLMIRGLQTQRGQLVKQMSDQPDLAGEIEKQLAQVDQQINELKFSPQNGLQQELDIDGATPAPRPPIDDELDGRPELDTYLANLDELDDQQLRELHSRVRRDGADERNTAELTAVQTLVQELEAQLQDIQARVAEGTLKPLGGKRLTTKVQKELAAAQLDVRAVETRMRAPESLVGDQLQMLLPPQQLGLDMAPSLDDQLGPIRALQNQREQMAGLAGDYDARLAAARDAKADPADIKALAAQQRNMRTTLAKLDEEIGSARTALSPEAQLELSAVRLRSEAEAVAEFGGYETAADYRASLEGWNRDQLRRLAMPEASPEVAALVQARTGRRVWQAKKSDIIDALVEIGQRRKRFLPPDPPQFDQGAFALTSNAVGGDAPLFDRPAELSAPGMTRMVDADGNEVLVPASEYVRRGLDAETRQRLKQEILQRAIDNGEVQAPFSPLPVRPQTDAFTQGDLVEQLFSDPTGQLPLLYAADELPTYKAGGKKAEALIDEMRLRFEYQVLDAAAARARREAFLTANGWDTMTWDQKRASGLLDPGQYSMTRAQLSAASEQVMSPAGMEPGISNRGPTDLQAPRPYRGEGAGVTYEWTPDGLKSANEVATPGAAETASDAVGAEPTVKAAGQPAAAPAAQADAAQASTPRLSAKEQLEAAKKVAAKREREAKARAAAEKKTLEIDSKRAADNSERIRKERARLEKLFSEGSCNG